MYFGLYLMANNLFDTYNGQNCSSIKIKSLSILLFVYFSIFGVECLPYVSNVLSTGQSYVFMESIF